MKPGECILGVEGGGTKTGWVLVETVAAVDAVNWEFHVINQGKLPPSNFRLTTPERLRVIFAELPKQIDRAGVFLAGCATEEDRRSLKQICLEIWPNAKIITGSDRDSGLAGALDHGDGIVVNAGSGSSVTGRRGERIERAGGWGHILGDAGGGYFLSIQALRLILREHDLHRGEISFAAKILHALSLNNLDELVRWVQTADKMDIAMLAPVVFEAANEGDARMMEIIEEGARVLCEYTEAVASGLHLLAPKVALIGGLFYRDSIYTHAFRRRLKKNLPDARVAVAERAPELGAAWLASELCDHTAVHPKLSETEIDGLAAALTEQRNPRSENLEKMSGRELVQVFVEEEQFVQAALRAAAAELTRAVEIVAESLRNGGRLFYVGAGSSGRIGVLDASEIPPTFGAPRELVQGVIAGGMTALSRSAEGAEDDETAGALAMDERRIKNPDVVIGISASGRTPFVLGALARAKQSSAKTILLTCNPTTAGGADARQPRSPIAATVLDLVITLPVGPEILTGSTRLKAGTATKVALNIISTGAMIALGKVRGNLMVDLHTTSAKLRDRAVRVVAKLTQCDYSSAREKLEANEWNLRRIIGGMDKK
ncbi:MAG: N-acetylmuramic acid 6-phosphate etherase [Verrucomicrobia bacterium]|nr:MAG: N-acetylmuramic acid 6-phosphate etherase [Verrucomicrobiota bacterium]PYJ34307.1 MAG: N-acetylmuramic acid 6-phosphate etherase [Verrucomicrobiota bacterium]